ERSKKSWCWTARDGRRWPLGVMPAMPRPGWRADRAALHRRPVRGAQKPPWAASLEATLRELTCAGGQLLSLPRPGPLHQLHPRLRPARGSRLRARCVHRARSAGSLAWPSGRWSRPRAVGTRWSPSCRRATPTTQSSPRSLMPWRQPRSAWRRPRSDGSPFRRNWAPRSWLGASRLLPLEERVTSPPSTTNTDTNPLDTDPDAHSHAHATRAAAQASTEACAARAPDLRLRPRWVWSRTTLRSRTDAGVTSTHSSSRMNSSACSSDNCWWGNNRS
ncbi:MAG: hypothetical protein QOF20_1508, partial [Acidimicrobiaceae bacterium]|nr:hypothetical protein [Acidimicrobiaceae bacterium]